jgi:hypothetical protein
MDFGYTNEQIDPYFLKAGFWASITVLSQQKYTIKTVKWIKSQQFYTQEP